jgi:Kef-type K+ transport system membrane component KefB
MHLHPIFGAFAFGFVCPRDGVTAEAAVGKLADASKILMPVFFVLTGLSMSVRDFGAHDVLVTVLVLISASAAKIFGVYATARACKVPSQDSWGLGLLMNTRGLTELVILDVGRTAGVLSDRMFTVLAVMAIGTTLLTGPVMERLYFGGAARSVWPIKWRGRRGDVKSMSPVNQQLSETNARLGNRYVDAWPGDYVTPSNSHQLDGESADSKP